MQTHNDVDNDMREYFRIQDNLALDYRLIDGPEGDLSDFTRQSPLFGLLGDLHMLDYESQHLLRQIAERDRALANYLKIINKRIDLVGKALATQLSEDLGVCVDVTISEGGMSFPAAEPLTPGTWLAIRMVLLPTPLGLIVPAKVVHCDPFATGKWTIGVSFEQLSDAQRQLLARHILQKQAQDIRAAKTEERTPT